MKKLSSRETIILVITLGLVVFFIAHQFVIKPMMEKSMGIDDQLRVDQESLIQAHRMIAQKALIEARYKSLAGLIGLTDSEPAQMPALISRIEAAARANNIHISNLQPQKSALRKGAVYPAVELDIDGQWFDTVRFLNALQQGPDFYFINEFDLEKSSDMTNSLRGRLVISRMSLAAP